jgi:O-antigen/teichoic acid export membrane protein
VVLAVTEIVGKLSMLLIVIGAARLLGAAEFGVFAYGLAVGTLAAVVPLWGYDTIVVQRGSAEPERLRALLADLLVIRTVLVLAAFAAAAGVLALTESSNRQAMVAALLVATAVILDTYTEAYRSAAAATQRQSIIAVVHLLQRLLTAAGAFAALLLHTGLLGLATAYLAGTLVGPLAGALVTWCQGIRPHWSEVSVASVLRLNTGTWMIGLASILGMALFRLDILFLAWFAGDRDVGVYAAVYRLLETALFVCWVVVRGVFPLMAADPEPLRVQRHLERGWGALAAVFLPYMMLLSCRGHEVLSLLYGEQFADGGTGILRWLAPAPLLFGLGYLIGFAMVAAGPTLRLLTVSAVSLAVNVVLNLLLIPRYGGTAAAFTTSLSYAVQALVSLWLGRDRVGRPRLMRTILPALAASCVAAGPLLAPLPLLPALLAAAALYLPCWLLVARLVDPQQTRALRRMLTPGRYT